MPLACEHVLLQTRCEMAVVALNHANACTHLYGQCVDIHSVVQQRERGIGVSQTVQRTVLPRTRAGDQPCLCDEGTEGLVQVL